MYKKIEFGVEAVNYIRECLSNGGTLSKFLLQNQNLNYGSVATYLPSTISNEFAKDFETGGKLPPFMDSPQFLDASDKKLALVPKPNIDHLLVKEITDHLKERKENICLFEDAWANPKDHFLITSDVEFSTYNDEVFYILNGENVSSKEILKTIRYARSWLFLGFLTSKSKTIVSDESIKFLTIDELELLAEKTTKVIVGAYDGEGFLIWNKK
ncbi:MAG TPA: hypothetical protein VGB02_16055 [Pyrinomonadaceae bacterium]|jgi:hypothetical protein